LVEGSVSHASLRPGIKESGFVGLIFAKLPAVPHRPSTSSELDEEHLLH
jgi:hypothetical protein